jgi:hypothetical protein
MATVFSVVSVYDPTSFRQAQLWLLRAGRLTLLAQLLLWTLILAPDFNIDGPRRAMASFIKLARVGTFQM